MFRPEEMCLVQIAGRARDKEKIMRSLQELGIMQVRKISAGEKEIKRAVEKKNSLLLSATECLKKIDELRGVFSNEGFLEKYLKSPVKQDLHSLDDGAFDVWASMKIEGILKKVRLQKRHIESLEKRISDDLQKLQILKLLRNKNVPLWNLGAHSSVVMGMAKTEKTNIQFLNSVGFVREIKERKGKKKTRAGIFFIIKKEHYEKAKPRLGDVELFSQIAYNTKPRQAIKLLRAEIKHNRRALLNAKKHLRSFDAEKPLVLAIEEKYKNLRERLALGPMIFETNDVFFVEGWTGKRDFEKINRIGNVCVFRKNAEKDAPTKLDNPPVVRSFERLTRLFAVPKYGEFDPTPFIAVFFPLFFGIMLTDIAYGFFLFAVSASVWLKAQDASLKDYSQIMALSAASTIFFGFVFGSFFGDLVKMDSIYNTYTQPVQIMFFSLALGLIHLNLGIFLKMKKSLEEKKGVLETLSLVGIEFGAIGAIGSALGTLPLQMFLVSAAVLAASVAFKLRRGYPGFMEITSFFSSWVSYVRLMALAVATGWLAFAINLGASLASAGTGILTVLVFFIGHAFSFVLNFFGALVHALRLHYVEFFSQFYEGGGIEFAPLKEEKKYHL